MGYTLLIPPFTNFNIYRIIDEITACIKAIKTKLVELGFKENKLRMAIGGTSAGGHLSLLYSYLNKNIDIIPLKFVINIVGPVGLNEKYFYRINSNNRTNALESIEEIDEIEKAKVENKIINIFDNFTILLLMDAFDGFKYSNETLRSMLIDNKTIDYENTIYKQMFKEVKYGYITEIEDKHKIPTICIYGGFDGILGVSTYAYLKEKAKKDGRHLDFIYDRYENHGLIKPETEDGKEQTKKLEKLIEDYIDKYFS